MSATSFFGGAFFGGEFFNTPAPEIIDTHDGFDTKKAEEWRKKREHLHDSLLQAFAQVTGERLPETTAPEALVAKVEALRQRTEIDITPLLEYARQLTVALEAYREAQDEEELMMVLAVSL